MATTEKEILLEIQVDSKNALKNVERAKLAIESIKEAQKKYQDQLKNGEIDRETYIKHMAALSNQMLKQKEIIRDNTKAHKDAVKANQEAEGSLQAMRGELSQLLKAYDALSKTEREDAEVGGKMLKHIQDLTGELKTAEEASGRFQRNVGNYQSIWDAPISKIEKFGGIIKGVFDFDAQIAKLKGLGDAFKGIGTTLDNASRTTIGFKKPITDAANATTQATAAVNANATATGAAATATRAATEATTAQTTATNAQSAATEGATRNTIGFNTATNTSAAASNTAAAAETAQAGAATGLGSALKSATSGVMSLLKATLKFIASPIGAIVAAIGVALVIVVKAVKNLTDAFKKNDDAMTALSSVMGIFKAIGAAVGKVFEGIVKAITPLIEGIGKLGRAIVSLIPGMKSYIDTQEDIVRSEDKLEEVRRKNVVERAKTDKEIAKLNNIVADSENYTVEQRRNAVEESIRLERMQTAAEIAEAKEALRIRKLRAQMDSDTSDETKNEIAQMTAELERLEAAGEAAQRRAIQRRASFNKEIENQRREAAKKAEEARKERIAKEEQAVQALQDLIIAQMIDGQEKEVTELKNGTQKQVKELQKRLATEKNLTAKAKKAIQEQIILIEANAQVEIGKIQEKYSAERLKRNVEAQTELWQARLAVAKKGTDEERMLMYLSLEDQEKNELEALKKRLADKEITEGQFMELQLLNQKKFEQQRQAIDATVRAEEQAQIKQEWANKIAIEAEGSLRQMDVKIEAKKAEIAALQQLEGESDEAYKGRQIALNNELLQMTKQRADAEMQIERGKAQATADLFGATSELLEQAGEDNKQAVMASKVLALAQVAIQQGIAISEAVASAAAGDPYTYALRVAVAIASTVAAMASAINSINEASFAKGGLVRGAGTATSDSIPARLSNGEFVVNAEATRQHLGELLAINGGWGATAPHNRHFADGGMAVEQYNAASNSEAIAAAVREAVADIQPVVSVKEITNVQKRVQVKEKIANS